MKHPLFTLKILARQSTLFLGVLSLTFSSCTGLKNETQVEAPEAPSDAPKPLYEWNGQGKQATHLLVNVDSQKLTVFSGNETIGWATVASGIHKFPTPTGDFKVIEKIADKKSNLYGKTYNSAGKLVNSDAKMGRDSIPEGGRFSGATMPYYLRLTGDGVGMHAGPIPRPGSRASHGCIRMPRAFAPLIFASTSVGTPVKIIGDGPAYEKYIAAERAAASRAYAARAKKKAAAAAALEAAGGAPIGPVATTDAAVAATPPAPTVAPPAPAAAEVEIKPAVPATPQQQ